jgi:aspartyl-tRNA(Asn)/glutamyl-tRNA(Gln) amidotransferase subunit A
MLQAIAGYDPADSTSVNTPVPDYLAGLEEGVAGKKIGMPQEYFNSELDPEVKRAVEKVVETYRNLGAEVVEMSLPHSKYAVSCCYLLSAAEASSNMARYDGVRFGTRVDPGKGLVEMYTATRSQGFGAEVKRRIMFGTLALSSDYYDAYYVKAQKVRTLIREDFTAAFSEVDYILTPATPASAFALGDKNADPLLMYQSDVFTVAANLAGICGLSLPCGSSSAGLPIGVQLLGRPFDEAGLLRIAYAYEQTETWHKAKPEL